MSNMLTALSSTQGMGQAGATLDTKKAAIELIGALFTDAVSCWQMYRDY